MESLDPYPWQSLVVLLSVCVLVIAAVILALLVQVKILSKMRNVSLLDKAMGVGVMVVVSSAMMVMLFTGDKIISTFHATGILLKLLFEGGV